MKSNTIGVLLTLMLVMSGCTMFKSDQRNATGGTAGTEETANVQTQAKNKEATDKAASLTSGWPESSATAAKEMIGKYGNPTETTSESLIWRNFAPFKEIIVHKAVYNHRFPLLHQNSLEHVVDYKAPMDKIDDVWRYNGSIVLDRTKGEMSSFADNEAMNVLGLNLAHNVLTGRMGADAARVTFGKETLNYMNGNKTAYTQVLNFGTQYETADPGQSVTNKIRWIGDPANQRRAPSQSINTRQAQEEKK
jgi:hypothetical protein